MELSKHLILFMLSLNLQQVGASWKFLGINPSGLYRQSCILIELWISIGVDEYVWGYHKAPFQLASTNTTEPD